MTNDESRLRLADYLSHMLEAARLARKYVENTVKADVLNDRRTQQAVVLSDRKQRARVDDIQPALVDLDFGQ
jgi:hypothetical protein